MVFPPIRARKTPPEAAFRVASTGATTIIERSGQVRHCPRLPGRIVGRAPPVRLALHALPFVVQERKPMLRFSAVRLGAWLAAWGFLFSAAEAARAQSGSLLFGNPQVAPLGLETVWSAHARVD